MSAIDIKKNNNEKELEDKNKILPLNSKKKRYFSKIRNMIKRKKDEKSN